jgi:thioredoxin reductase
MDIIPLTLVTPVSTECCAPAAQAECCDPSEKEACCGTSTADAARRFVDAVNLALPVVVIGAGPVGLATAAQLTARGQAFVLVEAGSAVAAGVRKWGHVRLFSPWRYLVDAAAHDLLRAHGWVAPPDDVHPTGAELVRDYLEPLAALAPIRDALRLDTRVVAVARRGFDKLKTRGRERAPFALRLRHADGSESHIQARAVIDASGTYSTPNTLGLGGMPAIGELAHAQRIAYAIPDVLATDRARYAGKRVLVVGAGHSAANAALDLLKLVEQEPSTRVTWAIRAQQPGTMFGGGANDQLSERGALGARAEAAVRAGRLTFVTGAQIDAITSDGAGVTVTTLDDRALGPFDEIIAATGFRPSLDMLGELRLALDDRNDAPVALAPLIDPNVHSCGSVPPHGVEELAHPAEPGFFMIGMKSYGRAPTFLMLTGYEQARSVVAALAGDWAAARDVRLVLPETGVCSLDGCKC